MFSFVDLGGSIELMQEFGKVKMNDNVGHTSFCNYILTETSLSWVAMPRVVALEEGCCGCAGARKLDEQKEAGALGTSGPSADITSSTVWSFSNST